MRLAVMAVAWLALIVAGGCTTLQRYPASELPSLQQSLVAGDAVSLTRKDGTVVAGTVTGTTPGGVSLDTGEASPTTVPWSDVRDAQRREFSGAKTTGLVLGGIVVLTAWLAAALEDDLEDAFSVSGAGR